LAGSKTRSTKEPGRIFNALGSGRASVASRSELAAARSRFGWPRWSPPTARSSPPIWKTDFLRAHAAAYPTLEVLRHDITAEDLPTGFDLVHARWLTEWLPDKPQALRRMVAALRPGGMLLDEEPDFVTIYEMAEPRALRRVMLEAMRHLQATCPVNCEYGRRLLDDVTAAGLVDTAAEGRCPVVRGGSPAAAHFLRLTLDKLRPALFAEQLVTVAEYTEAIATLGDPGSTIVMPMTVAAWGTRP
jgi:SAM-dependent methyltransferase